MSRANLYVRFPDGTLKYGIYNGTCDIADAVLYDDPHEAWEGQNSPHSPDYIEGSGEPVSVATDYGGGWSWTATATREYLTSGHDAMEINVDEDSLPSWAKYPGRPELDAIRARCDAATPVPWCVDRNDPLGEHVIFGSDPNNVICFDHHVDAEFIANARTDVPALLAEVERLTMKLAAANGQLGELWPRLSSVTRALDVEKDAPFDRPDAERVAWADGYTDACDFIRAAFTIGDQI